MKIESNEALFQLDLGEKENEVFTHVVGVLMNARAGLPLDGNKTTDVIGEINKYVGEIKGSIAEEILDLVDIKLKEMSKPNIETTSNDRPFKFMIGNCGCGEQFYMKAYEREDGTFGFNCRSCGKRHTIKLEELVKVEASCSQCGNMHFFHVAPGLEPNFIECRKCGHINPIRSNKSGPTIVTEK